ncbi:MAG: hydroxysqualene dehydroxylase HpnE [Aquincola sp.]|nr:hydroxysqualene dehydroxylase HpnE [Aquincola sp.]
MAIVGAGWAGLAAAVRATQAGHHVTLFEMAYHVGGRARTVDHDGKPLDNGQHILIGAYRETLDLMRTVGVDPDTVLHRRPLALLDPNGRGLALPAGTPVPAFVRGVLSMSTWPLRERWALLRTMFAWRLAGFMAPDDQTVATLTRGLPPRARERLTDPLCVAALNTPAEQASAQVFLRVLRDALFSGHGSADLMLPRVSLSELFPAPALRWLDTHGIEWFAGTKVDQVARELDAWTVAGRAFDAVVLACTPTQAARLSAPHAPDWSRTAAAFSYEPIVTVYLSSLGTRWPQPMTTLTADSGKPAQFAFDLGALDAHGSRSGLFAFVVSGARAWVDKGLDTTADAVLAQARVDFPADAWAQPPRLVRVLAERRATFLCTPGLRRPPSHVAPGLAAAGDYVDGPYPATLEGAVRSASAALDRLGLAR